MESLPLYRSPSIDRTQLSTAFFMTEFATNFITTPHFMASLFRTYFSVDSYGTINAGASASLSTPAVLAVNALAQGHFGRAMGDAASVQQSFHKYGLALKSMSSSISALGADDPTLDGVCEENWQHFAFFCVVMAFWELKMCPLSTNWQSHIRALSDAIALRGEDHPYSKTNKQLIAASRLMISLQILSSRQLGSLTPYESRKRSTIRSAWLTEAKTTIYTSDDLIPSWGTEIYTFLDSLMDSLPTLASLISRYDHQLVAQHLQTGEVGDSELSRALLKLYHEAETLLSQTELSATTWQTVVYEVSITECQSNSNGDQEEAKDHSKFWQMFEQDLHSLFDTLLHFHSMHEYQAFTLYWTVVISLHLQLTDIVSMMMAINSQFIPTNPEKEIHRHRAQLIKYAENVLRAISFAENVANRRLAPFSSPPLSR
uniref:Transcription factor domain-containing protein n=1 Tax=Bionectria ochroleuca TaxID=29856 RepID=A0A8H7NMF2_BIOOC